MSNTQITTGKTTKQYLFEVQLNWLADKKGILTAADVKGSIQVATPPAFGGEGNDWSPEHLFLSAISSCYMSTYLVFSGKAGFTISHLECNAIGQVELVNGKFQFTRVDVFPKIYIADEALKEKAEQAMLKTQHYCLVSNSISAETIYHGEVLKDLHPRALYQ